MEVSSSAFKNDGFIPAKYTCDGENVSPSINIEGILGKAKCLGVTASGTLHLIP